jgi:hypothetical protein
MGWLLNATAASMFDGARQVLLWESISGPGSPSAGEVAADNAVNVCVCPLMPGIKRARPANSTALMPQDKSLLQVLRWACGCVGGTKPQIQKAVVLQRTWRVRKCC